MYRGGIVPPAKCLGSYVYIPTIGYNCKTIQIILLKLEINGIGTTPEWVDLIADLGRGNFSRKVSYN